MSKYDELKQELQSILISVVSEHKEYTATEVSLFLTSSLLAIWGQNKLYSPDYKKTLSFIFEDEQAFETSWLKTAMECCADPDRELDVPDFFKAFVEKDLEDGTSKSYKLADDIGNFLAAGALINGDFTIAEASYWIKITNMLNDYCAEEGVKGSGSLTFHPESHITALNEESYLYSAGKSKKKKDFNLAPEDEESEEEDSFEEDSPKVVDKKEEPKEEKKKSATRKKKKDKDSKEEMFEELEGLIGLDEIKRDVKSLARFLMVAEKRKELGMKVPTVSYHLVFTGNPGTGKTTVARLVAKLYFQMGLLSQGQLIETDRSQLVAGYLGQTAIKTQDVIQSAIGGVLFIDEAYSLTEDPRDSYGKEAVDTLLKAMEDHRDDLVVIVAGYDGLMQKFVESNPGLRSRFNKYFRFADYDGEALTKIFLKFCKDNQYEVEEDYIEKLKTVFTGMYDNRKQHFGNARTVRNVFERAINIQADRLVENDEMTEESLRRLTSYDVEQALKGV